MPHFSAASTPGLIAPWGAHSSVFNPRTGDTHLLSILPAEILGLLIQGPLDLSEISDRMALLCETPNTPEWTEKMSSLTEELVRLELVDRLPG